MTNHKIKTQNGELILVEVPMEAKTFPMHDLLLWGKDVPFPDIKSCEILGTITNGVVDFDVEPYVGNGTEVKGSMFYKDYNNKKAFCRSAKDSFLSLLSSQSISTDNRKLIVLKIK